MKPSVPVIYNLATFSRPLRPCLHPFWSPHPPGMFLCAHKLGYSQLPRGLDAHFSRVPDNAALFSAWTRAVRKLQVIRALVAPSRHSHGFWCCQYRPRVQRSDACRCRLSVSLARRAKKRLESPRAKGEHRIARQADHISFAPSDDGGRGFLPEEHDPHAIFTARTNKAPTVCRTDDTPQRLRLFEVPHRGERVRKTANVGDGQECR